MSRYDKKINKLNERGGTTKGVYLPNFLIRKVYNEMQERESQGQEDVSFAGVVRSILVEHFTAMDSLKEVA